MCVYVLYYFANELQAISLPVTLLCLYNYHTSPPVVAAVTFPPWTPPTIGLLCVCRVYVQARIANSDLRAEWLRTGPIEPCDTGPLDSKPRAHISSCGVTSAQLSPLSPRTTTGHCCIVVPVALQGSFNCVKGVGKPGGL